MTDQKKPQPTSAYDAFNAVDSMVAKPVFGSDGAQNWQQFRAKSSAVPSKSSSAPLAPLKKSDRAAGFTSWIEERRNEEQVRAQTGESAVGAGYTVFKEKTDHEEIAARKERKRIEARRRPAKAEYFIAAETFQGWKFDYIFTTKDRGTGYYWDGMDSIKKLRGELKGEPPKPSAETTGKETTETVTTVPVKKKRKKSAPPVIVDDPNNPREQLANLLRRQQESLPAGWSSALDASTGKMYWYNTSTGERQWEKPSLQPLPPGWSLAKDPSSGKEYFYHAATGETKWERPS